jgi:hypothetical protein
MEYWQAIKGYEEYQVSNLGNVRRLQCFRVDGVKLKEKMMSKKVHSGGYLCCHIKGKTLYIHRLVASAFLENNKGYSQINHKDGNKKNNSVENLEWCSASQNMTHAYENNLSGYKERALDNVFLNSYGKIILDDGTEFSSTKDAAEFLDTKERYISRAIKSGKKHKGFFITGIKNRMMI